VNRRKLLAWSATAAWGTSAGAATLAQVRERGRLIVGLYEDMPPFHVKGRGIDVELGQALAEALGVKFAPLPFHADENMADDLRNMVWKGHYLGHGPADVLMHVPVDRPLIEATPQARIFGGVWMSCHGWRRCPSSAHAAWRWRARRWPAGC
jgi:ABC-type amino acid transport substrate-binding protein